MVRSHVKDDQEDGSWSDVKRYFENYLLIIYHGILILLDDDVFLIDENVWLSESVEKT